MYWFTNTFTHDAQIKGQKKMSQMFIIIFLLFQINFLYGSSISIEHLPIQDAGRIKPISSFSENQLLLIYEKKSLTYSYFFCFYTNSSN